MTSILTDEVLVVMAQKRIKARQERATQLATWDLNAVVRTGREYGIEYSPTYEGDLLSFIEVIVDAEYPQLITTAANDNEQPLIDEVGPWFASGEANAQTAAYMTPDVIKLDAQPMSPEFRDMGTAPETVTLDRGVYEELIRSEGSKYAIGRINKEMAEIHRDLNKGDTESAIDRVRSFAGRNGFVLGDIVSHDSPEDSPVKTLPVWVIADRIGYALDRLVDFPTLDVLRSYLVRPYHHEDSPHQNTIGVPEIRSALMNILNSRQVDVAIREYMTGHWSNNTVDAIIQVALASNGMVEPPIPVDVWPKAGPVDEATQITPIIETTEVDPSTQQPSYYGPMD